MFLGQFSLVNSYPLRTEQTGYAHAMRNTITAGLLVTLFVGLAVFSCNTEDTDRSFDPILTGRMRIAFDNVMGTSDLKLKTGTYQNAVGETFAVTKFNYFVSNIRLRKADGSEYVCRRTAVIF